MSKHGPRVSVSLDKLPASVQRLPRNMQGMILRKAFKKACDDYGIIPTYKEHQHFISKSEKRRRKKRQQMGEVKNNTTTRYWTKEEEFFN